MAWLLKIVEVTRRVPWPARYVSSLALVVACYGIQAGFEGLSQAYLFFIPAVVFSATLFDRGTGFFATLISAALIAVYIIEPRGDVSLEKLQDRTSLLAFLFIGFVTASIIEGLHLLTSQLRDAAAALRTSLARSEQLVAEKAALSAEMNHRIKNNLQITAAVLAMQARRGSPELAAKLQTAADRVAAMARIHNVVERRDDMTGVPARLFMTGLCADLRHALIADQRVELHCGALVELALSMDQASTMGLIINELVTNALKHAFPGGRQGRVDVGLAEDGGQLLLTVRDNGIGIAQETPLGLGRRLIDILVAKLAGSMSVDCSTGCDFRIRFPHQRPMQEADLPDAEITEAISQGKNIAV